MSHAGRGRAPLVLFVVALIVRLGWVLLTGRHALAYSDDAKADHDLAVNLVERHQFVTVIDPPHRLDVPYATRPPLTPLALAAVYLVFGPHLLAGQLLLACVGALSVVALYLLGARIFSEQVGIVAAVLAALYPFFVFLSAVPLTENLAILLYTILALCLTKSDRAHTPKHAAVTGCVLGLAALNRPQILGFVPLLAVLALVETAQPWAQRLRWLGVTLACTAAVAAPWVIRNHSALGGWFPISLQGGSVLYQGNNPYTQTALSRLEAGARGWYNDPRYGSELAGLTPMEGERKQLRLGMGFITEHPGEALRYSAQKVKIFFSAYADPVARASWYPVFAVSLLGFFWTAKRWCQLMPIHLLMFQTVLTAAIFTSMPRFRAPVEPFFLLMAAFALHQLWERRALVGSYRLPGGHGANTSARGVD